MSGGITGVNKYPLPSSDEHNMDLQVYDAITITSHTPKPKIIEKLQNIVHYALLLNLKNPHRIFNQPYFCEMTHPCAKSEVFVKNLKIEQK